MNIFQTIFNSVYNPEFYRKVKDQGLGKAFGYFFLLILLLSFVNALFSSHNFTVLFDEMKEPAYNAFPKDLELKIIDGKTSVNKKEPFFISMKDVYGEETEEIKNVAVIDTKTPFSQAKFEEYKTLAWLTKDTLLLQGGSGTEIVDLSKVDKFVLNYGVYSGWVDLFYQNKFLIVGGIAVVFLLIFYIVYIFNLLPLLLVALFIWLIAKKLAPHLTYKQSFTISLYAATAGLVLDFVLDFVAPEFTVPFLMPLLAIAVFVLNFQGKTKPVRKAAKRK